MSESDPDIRLGETRVTLPPAEDATLRFVGRIETPWTERADCPRQGTLDGPLCRVEVFEPWVPALDGIEAYPIIEILYWLDKSRRDLVSQSPKSDGRTTGTFALRSPVRPNPIGTSRVKLIERQGAFLLVRGLDCLNGTPLVDIKPDRSGYVPPAPTKAGLVSD